MSMYPNYPDPQEREVQENKLEDKLERIETQRIEEKIKAMSNVLEDKIGDLNELLQNEQAGFDDTTKALYQLTEEVSCDFSDWKAMESWKYEFLEQHNFTTKELFQYFILNIYKTEQP